MGKNTNIIQTLNIWKWFRREILQPIIQDEEVQYPKWFWADGYTVNYDYYSSGKTKLLDERDIDLLHLDRKWWDEVDYPAYFWMDRDTTYLSWLAPDLELDLKAKDTPRIWLNLEENKAHGVDEFG